METDQDSVGIDREHLCETLKAAELTLTEVFTRDIEENPFFRKVSPDNYI